MFILPDDFDYQIYIDLNYDLKLFNKEQAINHYISYGKLENRLYIKKLPDDFDCKCYVELNPDLVSLSEDELKNHYIYYGIREHRIYNNDNLFFKFIKNNSNNIFSKYTDSFYKINTYDN